MKFFPNGYFEWSIANDVLFSKESREGYETTISFSKERCEEAFCFASACLTTIHARVSFFFSII